MCSNLLRVAISTPPPAKTGPPPILYLRPNPTTTSCVHYILCHIYRPNPIYCAHYMLYPAQFHPLYIVSQPLFRAHPCKTQHLVSNPIQPLYLVLHNNYIQLYPISCIYTIPITTITTIYCTCAFSAPFPFTLATIYCAYAYTYHYILYHTISCTRIYITPLYIVYYVTRSPSARQPVYSTT